VHLLVLFLLFVTDTQTQGQYYGDFYAARQYSRENEQEDAGAGNTRSQALAGAAQNQLTI
jgi:hypothetical protein